jgi:hypothetical protein
MQRSKQYLATHTESITIIAASALVCITARSVYRNYPNLFKLRSNKEVL